MAYKSKSIKEYIERRVRELIAAGWPDWQIIQQLEAVMGRKAVVAEIQSKSWRCSSREVRPITGNRHHRVQTKESRCSEIRRRLIRQRGTMESRQKDPVLTGAAIIAIGRITKDPFIARYIHEAAIQIAKRNNVDFINTQIIREAQSVVRKAMTPKLDEAVNASGGAE